MSTKDLAQRLQVEGEELLDCLLCMLAANGVFRVTSKEDEDLGTLRFWSNNGLSRALQTIYMRPKEFDDILKSSMAVLETSIRKGLVPCQEACGASFWHVVGTSRETTRAVDLMMEQLFRPHLPGLLVCVDWSRFGTVVDVGGGRGHALTALVNHCPTLRGVVLDQETTVAEARATASAENKEDRIEFVGGDFFHSVPPGDALLLRWVLHNWKDVDCERILATCAKSLTLQGRLLIVEHVVPQHGCLPYAQLCAQLIGGVERTECEWRQLLARAGFRVLRVAPLLVSGEPHGSMSLIEAARFR